MPLFEELNPKRRFPYIVPGDAKNKELSRDTKFTPIGLQLLLFERNIVVYLRIEDHSLTDTLVNDVHLGPSIFLKHVPVLSIQSYNLLCCTERGQ
jgi:hypothetical protein